MQSGGFINIPLQSSGSWTILEIRPPMIPGNQGEGVIGPWAYYVSRKESTCHMSGYAGRLRARMGTR